MLLREFIVKQLRVLNERKVLREDVNFDVNFKSFPKEVLDTLKNEYGHYYQSNFDWNSKQDEFMDDPEGFHEWYRKNQSDEFIKNLDKLITKTRQDLILLTRKRNAQKTLESFEELIKPALDNSVLTKPLSKFLEFAYLNLHTKEELERAYQEAKNIIDPDGSIDYAKTTPSEIFVGGDINYPAFEYFVEKHPEYMGVFKDWKKLFFLDNELSTTDLNAYRDSTPYEKIKALYDFLVKYRNSNNIPKGSKKGFF
jgi:tetratricopeptide (TPR) repeat protein